MRVRSAAASPEGPPRCASAGQTTARIESANISLGKTGRFVVVLALIVGSFVLPRRGRAQDESLSKYEAVIREHVKRDYAGMLRPKSGAMAYPYLVPGAQHYGDTLWDWDSWLSDVALQQEMTEAGTPAEQAGAIAHGRGCVLDFLSYGGSNGWIPFKLSPDTPGRAKLMEALDIYATNMAKPCLAQHAAFLVKLAGGDAEWLRDYFPRLQQFVDRYRHFQRNKPTGLYFWNNDVGIGVDNDPCTYMRPPKSSGSIYLNCMMYKELEAMVYLSRCLHLDAIATEYQKNADDLKASIRRYCWDERDGFYYSVDFDLEPIKVPTNRSGWVAHAGYGRDYDCLIQRIGVWSGFLAMWAGIATPAQAKRMVEEHYRNKATFNANYGVRTLSKMEKMYDVRASGNPSMWLGPIWGVSNYLVFRGLVKYGYDADARELADKTIRLFGRDYERFGTLHEYYLPDSGEPVMNKGFQDWNYLVLNMMAWRDGKKVIAEF